VVIEKPFDHHNVVLGRAGGAGLEGQVPDEPVTVTVARQVAPGREADFAAWAERLTAAAARFPGSLGAGNLRPRHVGEPWHVVYRFASAAQLRDWEESAERGRLLTDGEELVCATDVQRVTGLETWFELPGRTAPAPPKWKMFAVSLIGIYLLQLVLNLALEPVHLAVALRVFVIAAAVTAAMTWLVMPRAARLLQNWLYAPPRQP
jgi:antibiotic biosynthesis monooxygenase (ABM) superfamily enzyme